MDYRTESFIKRFSSAQSLLKGSSIQSVISFKYRDDCINNFEYSRFIHEYIEGILGLDVKPLNGDFQGKGWLVSDSCQNSVILVEHETGLEILSIAGSLASLIALIPMINAGWKMFRGRFSHRPFHPDDRCSVEIRRLNAENVLIEQHIQNIETFILTASMEENNRVSKKVEKLEQEISDLRKMAVGKKESRKKPTGLLKRRKK